MRRNSRTASRSTACKSGGFTLLELLIVLFIMAVSAAMVLPRIGGSLPGVTLKAGARSVAASLRSARSQAVSQRIPYALVVFKEQQLLGVMPLGVLLESPESAVPVGYRYYQPPERVRIESAPADVLAQDENRSVIVFYAGGASSGGRITLHDARQRTYAVTVDAITGRIAIEKR